MKARIYRPEKSAMQSGRGKTGAWVLEYELVSGRRPEPLMGWTSAEDTLNQVRISFETEEQAIAFAQRERLEFTVAKAHERRVTPRNYADNFRYVPPEKA